MTSMMQDSSRYYDFGQKVITIIRTSSTPQTMLLGIARLLGQEFRADVCLLVAGIRSLESPHAALWSQDRILGISPSIAERFFLHPFVKETLSRTKPLGVEDLHETACEFLESLPEAEMSVSALLAITTYFQGRANGIMMVGYSQPHQWTNEENELLQVAAELGAIAYALAQFQKRTSPLANGTKALPLNKSPLFKRWYEATHQQLEQQRQLNELKDEIITAISDRARNPLASMKLAIRMLREEQLPPGVKEKRLDILEQEWSRLNDLINNIVTFKQLESHELTVTPQPVHLKPLINELTQFFQFQWQEDKRKRLTLTVNPDTSVDWETASNSVFDLHTDPQHLRRILLELLTNAGSFSLPDTAVVLTIRKETIAADPAIAITVTNSGRQISTEEREYIFEPFRRGKGVIQQSIAGTGLGLSLVKGLAELLNGTIELESKPTDDPEVFRHSFTLTLHQSPRQEA